jgi:4-oxalocrotonate tautomerase
LEAPIVRGSRTTGTDFEEKVHMPFIRVTALGSTLPPEQISRLGSGITALMEGVLGKKASLTSVLVEQPPAAGWFIDGEPAWIAVQVDANITVGTNSAEEKAEFIDKTMKLLRAVFGSGLSPVTYVIINEIPAQSWGYDGRTQESRRLAA